MGKARQWYTRYVRSVGGEWEKLQAKFCLTHFPISRVSHLHRDILNFKQEENESLGEAWAHLTNSASSGLDLSITEPTLMQHFYLGLRQTSAQFFDLSSKGAFLNLPISEGKDVLVTILKNTPYIDDHNEAPKADQTPRDETTTSKTPLSTSIAIKLELQIPQTSKEEETHPLNHSFDFETKLSDDPTSFGNSHKRPSKKHFSNPLKKKSLWKPPKSTPFYASSSQVAH